MVSWGRSWSSTSYVRSWSSGVFTAHPAADPKPITHALRAITRAAQLLRGTGPSYASSHQGAARTVVAHRLLRPRFVRADIVAEEDGMQKLQRILVAIDFSECSHAALESAAVFAEPVGASIDVL